LKIQKQYIGITESAHHLKSDEFFKSQYDLETNFTVNYSYLCEDENSTCYEDLLQQQ